MNTNDTLKEDILSEDRPFTDEEWEQAETIPPLGRFRTLIGLSEEEFSAQFGVSVSTLRDWEEGRAEADEAVMVQVMERVWEAREKYFATKSGAPSTKG